jgi:Ca2+/H+ antiporter
MANLNAWLASSSDPGALCEVTLSTGRTNVKPGAVHMVTFAAFLLLTLVP